MSDTQTPSAIGVEAQRAPDPFSDLKRQAPSIDGIFNDALDKVGRSGADEISALFESRLREILRLQALLAKAQADVDELRKKTPEELAVIALTEGHGRRAAPLSFDPNVRPRLPF
jgi:hypothetical protein